MVRIKKLKACVLAAFFYPVSGDVQDYPMNIAAILKESQHSVVVYTPDVYPDGRRVKNKGDNYRGIPIKRFHSYFNISWFSKFWFPKPLNKFDFIHLTGGYRHWHMFYAYLTKGKAKFLISPFYPMHPRKFPFNLLTKIIDYSVGRYILSRADVCFAETNEEAKWLKSLNAKKVVILPNSLLEEIFEKGNANKFKKKFNIKNKMILNIGRHVPIKNFEELIDVCKDLDVAVVIGGQETDYTKKVKKFIKRKNIKNVIFPGFMNLKMKRDAYAACDLFVLTSYRESLGTVLLEAMAQGKPVIGTNGGGIPNIVPSQSCLYRSGDKETLKLKIKRILRDKKVADELSKRSISKAKEFTYEKMKEKYLDILKTL